MGVVSDPTDSGLPCPSGSWECQQTDSSGNCLKYSCDSSSGTSTVSDNPTGTSSNPNNNSTPITVSPPKAKLSYTIKSSGEVDFFDGSLGTVTARKWTFGDGKTSTAQDPVHIYASGGSQSVTLTVANSGGSDTAGATVDVPDIVVPVADFEYYTVGRTVYFNNISTANGTPSWTLGDGTRSSLNAFTHTYQSDNTFTVKLTVGSYSVTKQIAVAQRTIPAEPGYSFVTWQNLVNCAVDGSHNLVSSVGAAATASTSDQIGTNTGEAFLFGVYRSVSGASISMQFKQPWSTVVLTLLFQSSGVMVLPQFGPPQGPFPEGSEYKVILTSHGYDFMIDNVIKYSGIGLAMAAPYISISPSGSSYCQVTGMQYTDGIAGPDVPVADPSEPAAGFTVAPTSGEAPLDIDITDTSVSDVDITAYLYEVSDGQTSTDQNPSFTLTDAGTYTIRQTISTSLGTYRREHQVVVSETLPFSPPPNAGITLDGTEYYVCDADNNQVLIYDNGGSLLYTVGSFGTGGGEFNAPTTLCLSGGGLQTTTRVLLENGPPQYDKQLYVVDSGNSRIEVFDLDGTYDRQFGADVLDSPYGIATDGEYLYVTDSGTGKVYVFDLAGTLLFSWNVAGTVTGIALDNSYVYVATTDTGGNVSVLLYTRYGEYVGAIGGLPVNDTADPVNIVSSDACIVVSCGAWDEAYIFDKSLAATTLEAYQLTLKNDIDGLTIPDLIFSLDIIGDPNYNPETPLVFGVDIYEGIKDLPFSTDIIPDVPGKYSKTIMKPSGRKR